MRIAVIGGGIFGCEIAEVLSKAPGNHVTLIERKENILLGASLNNQNRLHLGYHYPRDPDTAEMSAVGFRKFSEKYSSAISEKFDNYYFIANEDSKVSFLEFEEFCSENKLSFDRVNLNQL